MSLINYIYDNSPAFLQNVMCSFKGWLICKRRYNSVFFKELSRFLNHQVDVEEELRKFLLLTKNVEGYKGILSEQEYQLLGNGGLDVYTAIKKFPILNKEKVKSNIKRFCNKDYYGPIIEMHTSGTTGSGMVFPYSVTMENRQWATWWRYRIDLGITMETWCGWFGGRTIISANRRIKPYWRINRPGRQVMYSSYHLNKETAIEYYKDIKRRRLLWLHGYPSSIARLCSLFNELRFPSINEMKYITTGAENLLDYQIAIIKETFPNAIIRQHYGLSEGVANFSQDRMGNWHSDDDFCYIELIPLKSDDKSLCKIVGTGFSNEAFVLLRYDTGDLANVEWVDGKPKIVSFDGRKDDYITLPNGVKLGRLGFIFKHSTNIKEAQIHQHSLYDVEIKVVKGELYSRFDEEHLLNESRKRFGKDIKVSISYVDKIERTKSGKLRLVKSDI